MKKILLILCGVMLLSMIGFAQRGKTETIGKFSWYTEQNNFEDVLQVAKKANKPILAVFSATWCGPCQQVKTNLFKTDDFKKVADEVVLLYIEQTTKEGAAYNRKYNVVGFPSFKIFSAQGVLLDNGSPKRTGDGFLEWIREVNAGNNFHEFSRKLAENPDDRESLVKIADKMDWDAKNVPIDYLQRAIKIKPDYNDELSQKAYEKLAFYLVQRIPFSPGKEKQTYLADHQKIFQNIVDAYYPDKFKYELKINSGLNSILNWFYQAQESEKVFNYFSDYIKRKGDALDIAEAAPLFSFAVPSLASLGKVDAADNWIARIRDFSKKNERTKSDQSFIYYYSNIYNEIIKKYEMKGQDYNAEKYAAILSEEMLRLGQWMQAVMSITNQAAILGRMGKKAEAKKSLLGLYGNEALFRNLNEKSISYALNEIAWSMVELKIVDPTSLEIAEKAVALSPVPSNKDTLACVHAELGNFKEAVKIENEALAEEKDESSRREYAERIRSWQAKIK